MMVTVSMHPEMLRTVIKSISIGCDQLNKKQERLASNHDEERRLDIWQEYMILMNAKHKMEEALLNAISENPFS